MEPSFHLLQLFLVNYEYYSTQGAICLGNCKKKIYSLVILIHETELRIRNNLNAWLHDTTVLIITQRIYTMQSANRVILLDDGEVESIGTPEELLERSEMYREIYHSQQIVI